MAGIGNPDSRCPPLDKMSGSGGACPYRKIVYIYATAHRHPLTGKLANAIFPLFGGIIKTSTKFQLRNASILPQVFVNRQQKNDPSHIRAVSYDLFLLIGMR